MVVNFQISMYFLDKMGDYKLLKDSPVWNYVKVKVK